MLHVAPLVVIEEDPELAGERYKPRPKFDNKINNLHPSAPLTQDEARKQLVQKLLPAFKTILGMSNFKFPKSVVASLLKKSTDYDVLRVLGFLHYICVLAIGVLCVELEV